ncbi:NADPH-dependent FMN reductase [Spirillospora sp. CA-294931]|uniref:NADPH-dependent FMN reductase n=1 Tax=Spirillospora sp. CA-294931 TaxID=3240042 RepID=UPI003D8FCA38
MNDHPLRVAIIVGSTREGRFGPVVADWFTGQAKGHAGVDIDVIDLAETDLPYVLGHGTDDLDSVRARLSEADAFVVITPEYNHSYPASLKNVIDHHFFEWRAKPVAFVSYGGLSGGLRAVEHLRAVFAELHAVSIRDTVSFHGAGDAFHENGDPKEPDGCNAAAASLLDQLTWWARALREARTKIPYAA